MMFIRREGNLIGIKRKPKTKLLPEGTDTDACADIHAGGILRKGNVLIVDDEIDIVQPLLEYLSKNGYIAIGHTSGKDAVEALKEYDFDLLVVDLVLPDMNGIDLLKAASKIDPHLVGIIITGKGTIQTAVNAMKAGAFDYLLKPFQFTMLSAILDRAMHMRQLKISEERYRILVGELTNKMKELQNAGDKLAMREVEIFELREEIEDLKEASRKLKEMESSFFFNGIE